MFHTLFDYQDQNIPNNKQTQKNKFKDYNKKSSQENYYGKGNQAYELYNKTYNDSEGSENSEDSNGKFEKTKNKIKLIVYKNGFILNGGEFRDKSIQKNAEFLEQVERGVIPHEIQKKGINDLGILLINRKTEIYHDFEKTMKEKNFKSLNTFQNFDFYNIQNQNIGQNQYKKRPPKYKSNNIIPLGMIRNNSSINMFKKPKENDCKKEKRANINRESTSEPKDNEKSKKFIAFSGSGKMVRNISTKGLHVNKSIKTVVDTYQPIYLINIRLFNGEIVKCQFNATQTLRDIYYHVRNISGSNNFYLLDGFPPRQLREYDKPIYELGIKNSLLTQKIN